MESFIVGSVDLGKRGSLLEMVPPSVPRRATRDRQLAFHSPVNHLASVALLPADRVEAIHHASLRVLKERLA